MELDIFLLNFASFEFPNLKKFKAIWMSVRTLLLTTAGAGISFRNFIEILLVAGAELQMLSRITEGMCITSQSK